ncbi:peptidoglycan-binding protein [Candidatus Kaiserbacteria bacterium]|nr:peptidoglycan-binding protein [Candidatus Kaiserbacteria bacterium]
MPRMLARAGILVALFAPSFAFAAFDDVTLTTDTVLSVGGITLNVSGSSATIESITVNAGDFSVVLSSGSVFQVTAPGLERITADTLTGVASDVCNSSQSLLKYQPSTSVTVTISPSSTLCSSTSSGGSASTGGSSSSAVSSTPAASTPAVTPTVTPTVTPVVTPAVTPAKSASGLSVTQIKSILDVLASFNADADVIAKVKMSLEGTVTTGSVTSTAVGVFKANLTVGSLGSEVKALQEFLNAKGYTVATSGAGSAGNETTKFGSLTKAALIKYQKAKGITPAVGYFGPVTRAAVKADR